MMPTLVKILLSGGWAFVRPLLAELTVVLSRDFLGLLQQFVQEAERHPNWSREEKKAFVAKWLSTYHPEVSNKIEGALLDFLISAAARRISTGVDPKPGLHEVPTGNLYGRLLDLRPEGLKNGDRVYYNPVIRGWYVTPKGPAAEPPAGYKLAEVVGIK